jgi:hypothetical protein
VQCGEVSVRWYHLRRALFKYSAMLPHSVVALATDLTSVGIEQLQNLTLGAKCTEPRDRVYAMLGLFPPAVARLFKPRYDIPVAELYAQMVINTIQETRRMNIHFGEDTNQSPGNDKLPSWVPVSIHFSDQKRRPLQVGASHASGDSSAFAIYMPPHELHVSGVLHDTIEAVSGVILSSLNAKDVIRSVRECWEAVVDSPDSLDSAFPTDELVWMIAMGRLANRWLGASGLPDLDEAKEILRELVGSENSTIHNNYSTWTSVVVKILVGLRLARTAEGRVCICNQSTQPGDIIAVLLGHDYPMLLRPSPETARKYRVLSRCYMYGIMDAEAILGPLPVSWKVGLVHALRPGEKTRCMFSESPIHSYYMHDPRFGLGSFPQHWEPIEMEDEMRLSWEVQHYRHRITGEVINSDPRMLPDSLKARGVQIETICLI